MDKEREKIMDQRERLCKQIEQAERDKRLNQVTADKEIARLRQKLENAEATYSIADRFEREGEKFFLAGVNNGEVVLTSLRDGLSCERPQVVGFSGRITQTEFNAIASGNTFHRYYDHIKEGANA